MKVSGGMICSMEKAKKVGQMARCIKGSIWLARNMAGACIAGMMGQDMMVNGMKTKSKEWELIVG